MDVEQSGHEVFDHYHSSWFCINRNKLLWGETRLPSRGHSINSPREVTSVLHSNYMEGTVSKRVDLVLQKGTFEFLDRDSVRGFQVMFASSRT